MGRRVSSKDLAVLEILLSEATPGPWEWEPAIEAEPGRSLVRQGATLGDTLITLGDTYENAGVDCELVETALRLLPDLIAEVRAARGSQKS